jgi:hypothetical protein
MGNLPCEKKGKVGKSIKFKASIHKGHDSMFGRNQKFITPKVQKNTTQNLKLTKKCNYRFDNKKILIQIFTY